MTALRCCKYALGAWLVCAPALAQLEPLDSDHDTVIDMLELKGDSDGDGIPDYLDPDDDNDSVLTRFEYIVGEVVDFDRDNAPDYLDVDDDNDRILTKDEQPDPDGDGNPKDARATTVGLRDYLNPDDDDDGVITQRERPDDKDQDIDGDHTPDYRDKDDDGDSRFTVEESGGSGLDSDGDKLPDYLDPDDDNDTIPTIVEMMVFAWRDMDSDGLLNPLDLDSDNDGIPDQVEGTGDEDGDGIPDYLDAIDNRKPDDGQGNVLVGLGDAGRDGGTKDAGRDAAVISLLDASEDGTGGDTPVLTTESKSSGCALGATGGDAWALLMLLSLRRRRRT